ncbi:hypothetical protein GCM10007938_07400 [Vibrio zhanjiangensis]|uniref:DUF2861 family protein n=1 Tax=Vibrio zhanjiangensis TaxID=1046128 RepID=A0ABQ6EUW7_9VIBR|nr:DUF2861 family protein [Vibrio zhanjiangensis]GLT16963.1 hypothetical protein GCM10007938_07400 [Vibrio zhanjiangensis]
MTKKNILLAFTMFSQIHSAQASWFAQTPLQPVYQTLVNHQPQLAWQELVLAISNNTIDSQYWLPAKQEILKQTSCGQALFNHDEPIVADISITFIRRSGLSSQGFQIKLSAENTKADSIVELISPSSKVLLHANLYQPLAYQEYETEEMLSKPMTGIYTLRINKIPYPLLITMPNNKRWITYDSTEHKVHTAPPEVINRCSQASAVWQWFDSTYTMLGSKIPIQRGKASIPRPLPPYQKAKYLSASVSVFEYQQGIKVGYIQRVSIPFSLGESQEK